MASARAYRLTGSTQRPRRKTVAGRNSQKHKATVTVNYKYEAGLPRSFMQDKWEEEIANVRRAVLHCPKPYGPRVAVLPDTVADVSSGGIIKVEEFKEVPHTGTVVAVGDGRLIENTGLTYPVRLAVMDRVYHGKYAGIAIDLEDGADGIEVILLHEDEVLAFVPADPSDYDNDLPF